MEGNTLLITCKWACHAHMARHTHADIGCSAEVLKRKTEAACWPNQNRAPMCVHPYVQSEC
jgi:hypothetical protein